MRSWTYVESRGIDQFTVILDWTHEDALICDVFDADCHDIEDMKRRCNAGIDTHYIARVRVIYKGHTMGCATLGSCYASDCDPEDDIQSGISGYLEGMIDEALKLAN